MTRLIVFDLDGVLIDSEEANYQAFAHGLQQAGLAVPDKAAVISLIGLKATTMLERLGCPPARSLEVFDGWVKPHYLENLPLLARQMDRAEAVLSQLKETGWRIAACTSGDRMTQRRALEAIGLWSFIEEMQTPDDSSFGKPDPRYLGEVVERFQPQRLVHVEDSEVGIRMGQAYGATTVHASYGYGQLSPEVQPDHVITSLSELPALLK